MSSISFKENRLGFPEDMEVENSPQNLKGTNTARSYLGLSTLDKFSIYPNKNVNANHNHNKLMHAQRNNYLSSNPRPKYGYYSTQPFKPHSLALSILNPSNPSQLTPPDFVSQQKNPNSTTLPNLEDLLDQPKTEEIEQVRISPEVPFQNSSELSQDISGIEKMYNSNAGYNTEVALAFCEFCHLLENDSVIEELDLSYNHINGRACMVLAKSLAVNKTLTSISLIGNPLGLRGIHALEKALELNSVLVHLEITEKQTDRYGSSVRRIHKLLTRNRKLNNQECSHLSPMMGGVTNSDSFSFPEQSPRGDAEHFGKDNVNEDDTLNFSVSMVGKRSEFNDQTNMSPEQMEHLELQNLRYQNKTYQNDIKKLRAQLLEAAAEQNLLSLQLSARTRELGVSKSQVATLQESLKVLTKIRGEEGKLEEDLFNKISFLIKHSAGQRTELLIAMDALQKLQHIRNE